MGQPIEGAQSGADGTQSGAVTGGTEGTTGTGTDGTQSGAGAANQNTTTQTPSEADQLRSELEAQRERTRAADQNQAKLAAELKALKEKDLPEAERVKAQIETLTREKAQLETDLRQSRIANAFLKDNTHEWRDPSLALKTADLSKVDIDSDGNVTGLKDALKALATAYPFMLKEKSEGTGGGPGGTPPGNNGNAGSGKPDVKQMRSRLPAMGTRIKSS